MMFSLLTYICVTRPLWVKGRQWTSFSVKNFPGLEDSSYERLVGKVPWLHAWTFGLENQPSEAFADRVPSINYSHGSRLWSLWLVNGRFYPYPSGLVHVQWSIASEATLKNRGKLTTCILWEHNHKKHTKTKQCVCSMGYTLHDDVIKGDIFRVTGHLCGEFTGPRWIPRTKASDAELWCFLWSASE